MKVVRFLIALCIPLFGVVNTNAQCDGNSDIIQDDHNVHLSGSVFPLVGNTFTATCSGKIKGVSFWTHRVPGTIGETSVTVELWSKPLSSARTNIKSRTLDIPFSNSPQEHYFEFESNLPQVASGELYAFRVVKGDDSQIIDFQNTAFTDIYTGGKFFWGPNWTTERPQSDWDLRFHIHYLDEVNPVARCRSITRTLGADGTVSILPDDINNGSTDAGSGISFKDISKSTFDCSDIGENTVTLFLRDIEDNPASCEATVTIVDNTGPILGCPDDITVYTHSGVPVVVTYDDNITYSDCSIEAPDGFTFLAARDGTSYFMSNNTVQAQNAQADAEALGGFVATVWDSDHNDRLRVAANNAGFTGPLLIGYSDAATEGFFRWHGTNSGYSNWREGEPNNDGDEDYVHLRGNGEWNDINRDSATRYILELSTPPTITRITGLASGSTFPVGVTTNTFQATDGSGNTGTCSFTVSVIPYESSVILDNGKLSITDIGNISNDEVILSNDGATLTISNLSSPAFTRGGPRRPNLTTVTVPLSSITAGIEFSGGGGVNTITFADELTLTGANNNISIKGISGYEQSGNINLDGSFTIAESPNAIIALHDLKVGNLSITANRIWDTGGPINISGTTTLKTSGTIRIAGGISNHQFGGAVSMEASNIVLFTAGGNTTFGAVTTTDATNVTNSIYISPGNMTFTDAVKTAGVSELLLRGDGFIQQTINGSITTNVLTLRGKNDGSTSAFLDSTNNDVSILETYSNNTLDVIDFKDINDLELSDFAVNEFSLTAKTFILSEDTKITKVGTRTGTFNGNINVVNTSTINPATINHNGGTITFNGLSNKFNAPLAYTSALGTTTKFNGNTTINNEGGNMIFGILNATGNFNINTPVTTLTEARFSDALTIVRGNLGTFLGGPVIIESGAAIEPGTIDATGLISTNSLTISSATFASNIKNDNSYSSLSVTGTVNLIDARIMLSGDLTMNSGDEVVLIANDKEDAIVGIFNNLPEGSLIQVGDFTAKISYVGGDGNDVSILPAILVKPSVFLQGAALNPNNGEESLMRDDLREVGLIPTTSPYSDNLVADASVFTVTGSDAIVDWVWVELRHKISNTVLVNSQSALLQRDGNIVAIDGMSDLSFYQSPDNYYVVIKHRNHLGIMSKAPIALSSTSSSVDFTKSSTQTYGTNAQTTFGMPTGVVGMWSGDADGDGNINFGFDNNKILLDLLLHPDNITFSSSFSLGDGYSDADLDLSGNISFQDEGNTLLLNVLVFPDNSSFNSSYGLFDAQLPIIITEKNAIDKVNIEAHKDIDQKINNILSNINK